MLFMIPSIGEWMIGEKREGNIVAIKQFTVSSNFKSWILFLKNNIDKETEAHESTAHIYTVL